MLQIPYDVYTWYMLASCHTPVIIRAITYQAFLIIYQANIYVYMLIPARQYL